MYNILICDDEKDIVNALEIYLTNPNYKIYKAYNGKEALQIIGDEDIHLVLMDIMMPEMDGISAMVKMREYDILKLLITHPGQVFAPKEIYEKVWKEKPMGCDKTVAVPIRHLREKLEINPAEPRYLKVIFGQGYMMEKGNRG